MTDQKLNLAKVLDDGYRPSNDGLSVSEHIAIVQCARATAATTTPRWSGRSASSRRRNASSRR